MMMMMLMETGTMRLLDDSICIRAASSIGATHGNITTQQHPTSALFMLPAGECCASGISMVMAWDEACSWHDYRASGCFVNMHAACTQPRFASLYFTRCESSMTCWFDT